MVESSYHYGEAPGEAAMGPLTMYPQSTPQHYVCSRHRLSVSALVQEPCPSLAGRQEASPPAGPALASDEMRVCLGIIVE